jgi:hypothetical protein
MDEDGSLIAFEIKGYKCNRVDLENLFFQGLEHQHWLEHNKLAIKLLYDNASKKYLETGINSSKQVRLILGFYKDKVPNLFEEMRIKAENANPDLKIEFVQLRNHGSEISLKSF